MPTCPAGHDSASSDFCDVCGMRIGGTAQAAAAQAGPVPSAATPPAHPCPRCGTGRSGQFCEACGFDFNSGSAPSLGSAGGPGVSAPMGSAGPGGSAPTWSAGPGGSAPPGSARPATWTVLVAADRAYYDHVIAEGGPDAGTFEFPGYCPERRFPLGGQEMRIGRHSASRGLHPEIDLTGPPTDPGVSRLHAVLIPELDGSWAVIDPGSENGTLVNDKEIATGVRVPLHDGDRIHLGAWTVLTIQAL
jgi:hypothetical protein